ncbi:hypothetical protein D1007_11152 [Hordeum vulgare]|nr:hypothetical protein D1007_11152 [Hordeum vulgare]
MGAEAAEAEAARNRPPRVPQLRTQAEKMAFLVSTIQGMEKNIQEIMQNRKSLERFVETKFHNMDMKVTELTTIVRQLQHEVDYVDIPRSGDEYEDDDDYEDESPPPTTTQFNTRPRYLLQTTKKADSEKKTKHATGTSTAWVPILASRPMTRNHVNMKIMDKATTYM